MQAARMGQLRVRPVHLIILSAAAFVLADLVIIWIGSQRDFAFDFICCYQQAADRALNAPSTLYEWSDTYTFRYTPIGALVFAPLVGLTPQAAAWTWLIVKLAILAGTAVWFSRAWPPERRWLIIALVVAFPPIVHDLVIGNVSTLTLLVFVAVARWPDARGGVALGLLTVLMPKPHLIPVLAYLAVRRPRDFLTALATIAAGVAVGLAIFGLDPWLAFIGTLREPLERTFTANVGWSGLLGPAGVVVGMALAVVAFVAAVKLGGARGYGLSIIAGILAGPYTFIHYLAGTLVAAEPVLHVSPRRLWPFPWLLVVFPLIPVWLTALGWVVWATPAERREPEPAEGAPPGGARG
jgi:hypothetical protein